MKREALAEARIGVIGARRQAGKTRREAGRVGGSADPIEPRKSPSRRRNRAGLAQFDDDFGRFGGAEILANLRFVAAANDLSMKNFVNFQLTP